MSPPHHQRGIWTPTKHSIKSGGVLQDTEMARPKQPFFFVSAQKNALSKTAKQCRIPLGRIAFFLFGGFQGQPDPGWDGSNTTKLLGKCQFDRQELSRFSKIKLEEEKNSAASERGGPHFDRPEKILVGLVLETFGFSLLKTDKGSHLWRKPGHR